MTLPAGAPARGSVVVFLLVTFAASWAFFIPVALTGGATVTPLAQALLLAGTIAPSLVALGLTARTAGRPGVRALVAPIGRLQAPAAAYLFAVGYTAAVKLAAAVILRATSGAWPRFGSEPLALIPFAIALSTPVQAGEELGWRGYALPRLAARLGLGPASLLLGVIWAVWHLPLFFLRGADTYGQSFPLFLLQVTAISVTMAWLYARTESLLLVMLLHAAINNSKDIVPSATSGATNVFGWTTSPVARIALALMWIVAVVCLVRMRDPKLKVPGAS